MKSTLEKDLIDSSVNLVESTVLDVYDYTEITASIINNFEEKHTIFQLISVKSEYDGEMKVFVDGKSNGEFFIEKGVNQIPLYLEVKGQITTYFVLDFKYKEDTCLTENIQVKMI